MTFDDRDLGDRMNRIAASRVPPPDATAIVMTRLRAARGRRRALGGTFGVVAAISLATGAYAMLNHASDSRPPDASAERTSNTLSTSTPSNTPHLPCPRHKAGIADYAPDAKGSPSIEKALALYISPAYPLTQPGDHVEMIEAHRNVARAAVLRVDGVPRTLLTLFHNGQGWFVDTYEECVGSTG